MSDVQETTVQETTAEPAIIWSLRRLPPMEQHRLLEWSRGLGAIRYGTLSAGRKIAALLGLTRDHQALWPLVKVLAGAVRYVVWDARSWMFRLGVGALLTVLIAFDNAGANTVALGGGIRLPLWILVGAGGAAIGWLVDRLKVRRRRRVV